MKEKIIIGLMLVLLGSCRAQNIQKLTFDKLKNEAIDFLVKKNELKPDRAEKMKSGEFNAFTLKGVNNNLSKGNLKNGMYSFSLLDDHCKGYFLLVEKDNYIILDIGTREGLDEALKNTLLFCERNKYCVDITNDYISRLIGVYYNINKDPLNGHDVNCERGINDFKSLP